MEIIRSIIVCDALDGLYQVRKCYETYDNEYFIERNGELEWIHYNEYLDLKDNYKDYLSKES